MPSTRTLIAILSLSLVATYSILAMSTSGGLNTYTWPLLAVAIGLPILFEARKEAAAAASPAA